MKNALLKSCIIPLTAILLVISPLNALASTSNNQTKVIISKEAENIPDYMVEQIITENPDAGVITIYEYGDIVKSKSNEIIEKNKIRLLDLWQVIWFYMKI